MNKKSGHNSFRTDADGFAAMTPNALVILEVTRAEIETGLYSSALERLLVLNDTRENALLYRESLFLQVIGYDDDSRELPEIPEVRDFFTKLTQAWPHWMWFLSRELGTLHLLVSLLSPILMHRKTGSGFGIEFSDHQHLMEQLTDLLSRDGAMFAALSISEHDAQESAASALYALLGE